MKRDESKTKAELISELRDLRQQVKRLKALEVERKEIQDKLAASEVRYRRLFETAQDGILILNAESGGITDVNPFLTDMLGYPKEELLGKQLWEIGFFKDIAANRQAFRTLQDKGYIRYEDLPLETKDGRSMDVEFVSNVYRINGGQVIQCNIRDITDRKKAEEEIKDLAKFPGENPNAVLRISRSGLLMYANDGSAVLCRLWKCRLGDSLPDDARALVMEASQTGLNREVEVNVDGRVYSLLYVPVAGKDYVNIYGTDITERKKAEEEAARTAREWSSTFDAIQDFISIHDKDFKVVRANRAFASALGMNVGECVGKNCYQLFHGTQEPWVDCPHRQAMESGKPVNSEFFEPRLGKYLDVFCLPILDDGGEFTGTVHIARDVTGRKRVEDTLERAFKESERQRAETTAIAEALRAIINTPRFKDAASSVFNICKRITGATGGYVALVSEDGTRNEVLFLDSGGIPCTVDQNLPMPIRGLREKVLSTGQVVYDNDFAGSEWVKLMPPGHVALGNVLFAPLIIESKALGLIGLANKSGGFTERDARIMGAMGELTSIGLQKARAAEALAESERRFRNLIETTTEGVWIARTSGESIFMNKRMADMLGYTQEEMLGRKREEFIDPEYIEFALKQRAQRAKEIAGTYEIKLRHKNGSIIWALVSASPVFDEAGNHVANLGMHAEITERKKAEEKLAEYRDHLEELVKERTAELNEAVSELEAEVAFRKQAEEALGLRALMLDSASEAVFVRGLDGKIVYANKAAEAMYGYSRDELANINYRDLVAPEARSTYDKWQADRLATGEIKIETVHVRKDGSTMPIETYSNVVTSEGRTLVLNVVRDITERKKAEVQLRTAALYARSLIEASLDPLVTINAEGLITDVNRATEAATGVSRENLIGTNFTGCFTQPEKAEEGYRQVFADGYVRDYPLTIRHTSGATMDVLYNASLFRDEEGEVQGVFAAARDVTATRRLEVELRRSNAELQQFAYIISHDLQEPLRMIASYLQLLERRYKGNLDKNADEFINYAVDGANRMKYMINDLLEYSLVNTRGKPCEMASCEEALDIALANLRGAIVESDAVIIRDPLPVVMADSSQLVQLFMNLVGNAIKFRGAEPPRIHISVTKAEQEWFFSVRDNGIGIEPQYHDRIFRIFQRLHTRDEYPGAGMGLAIAKRIVERHGGRIWVESEQGEGAIFHFAFPITA